MKRSLKIEIDVKFAVVTLILSALVIFMVYLFASSSVFAEESGYVGEYVDEFDQAETAPAPTSAIPTVEMTTRNPVQAAQVFPTVEAAKVGTASDPLITLSYLQNIAIPQLESSLLAKIAAGTVPQQPNNTPSQTSGGSYTVLELSQGQTVVSKTGSLEIIARPGTVASVVSPFGDQGLADLTDGTELLGGQNVPLNHILLVPRNDGRGISVVSLKAYVMVRGDYEIR